MSSLEKMLPMLWVMCCLTTAGGRVIPYWSSRSKYCAMKPLISTCSWIVKYHINERIKQKDVHNEIIKFCLSSLCCTLHSIHNWSLSLMLKHTRRARAHVHTHTITVYKNRHTYTYTNIYNFCFIYRENLTKLNLNFLIFLSCSP